MNIRCFCCMGDSITSDQVSGIGTMVAHRLNAQEVLNAACGYATCSDWHEGDRNITPVTLIEPPNTNTADNVLSNQVRRVLQALTPKGSIIRWTVDGIEYAIPAEIGVGTGTLSTPDVIYIAISSNDGNQPENAPADDFAAVCELPYADLTRTSMASALLWAVLTLQAAARTRRFFSPRRCKHTPRRNGWTNLTGCSSAVSSRKSRRKRGCTASTASTEAALTAALPALTAKSTRTRNGKSALLTL